jgi:ABC-type phosphate/phosphonate transport system substrate-binding protein
MAGQQKVRAARVTWALAIGTSLALTFAAQAKGTKRKVMRIGMASTFFKDMPGPMVHSCTRLFQTLMESQTGLKGKIVPGGSAFDLAAKLKAREVQLGVFHGFEFAWAQQKYPGLRPLMIAVNQKRHLHACIVVRKDQSAADFSSLAGKKFAVCSSSEHSMLFLDRRCQAQGKRPDQFFGTIKATATPGDALADLAAGKVDGAVVDVLSLPCFKSRNPAGYSKIKVLEKSPAFPAGVVAYYAGALDKSTLKRFKTGMLNATNTAYGRHLLTFAKMTGFEPVPKDYQHLLTQVVKTYPPQGGTFTVSATNEPSAP